jgi:hypothetical protein
LYISDARGRVRHRHVGEGDEAYCEQMIRRSLADLLGADPPVEPVRVDPVGIELPVDAPNLRSPETYIGLARSRGFASQEPPAFEEARSYTVPSELQINEWALGGVWTFGRELAVSSAAHDRITYRFHARDLHMVVAPPPSGAPVRFRVRLDGHAPGAAHGLDTDGGGNGVVTEARLHQLLRQEGLVTARRFEIEFLDPGLAALCFTFG